MRKIIKETSKTIYLFDVILYLIYIVIGCIMLKYPEIEVLKPIEYASPIFYLLGFFSLITYFLNRRNNDYEFLLLGLINIVVGTYILFYSYFDDTGFILGNALLIYSLANILNKGWHTIKLSRNNDIKMFPKFAITILLTLLGFLVISNLYNEVTMQTLILGYYYLSFGVLSLIEPIMILVMKHKKLNNYLINLLEENYKKEKVVIKEIQPENINKKELKFKKIPEIKEEKTVNINKKTNNKKKKTSSNKKTISNKTTAKNKKTK